MIVQYTLPDNGLIAIDLAKVQAVREVLDIENVSRCAIDGCQVDVPLPIVAMVMLWREGLALSVGRTGRVWLDLDEGRIFAGFGESVTVPYDLRRVIDLYQILKGVAKPPEADSPVPLTDSDLQPQEPAQ